MNAPVVDHSEFCLSQEWDHKLDNYTESHSAPIIENTEKWVPCYPGMLELKQAMPTIAELLNTTTDNLKVFDFWSFPTHHMVSSYADKVIKTVGLHNDLPLIQNSSFHSKKHGKGKIGLGMLLYQCRNMEESKPLVGTNIAKKHGDYVLYNTKNLSGWTDSYIICRKGEAYRIIRNCQRLAKLANIEEKPILEAGLMNEIVKSSIGFLLNYKQIKKYGVRIKRGILLDGPPGNGKTMVCRYIQNLCTANDIDWGTVNASDIDKAYADNEMENLFNRYTVTFFDDIDISYLSRKAGNGKIACSILTCMDGMFRTNHTVRFFTTNEAIDDLDQAFIRPGRIDKRFIFNMPTAELRTQLLKTWPEEIIQNIDTAKLIRQTNANSFAEIEAIRANLVTNYIFGKDHIWDLEKALADFKESAGSFFLKKNKVGFIKSNSQDNSSTPDSIPNSPPSFGGSWGQR